jgi:hypothetical protein
MPALVRVIPEDVRAGVERVVPRRHEPQELNQSNDVVVVVELGRQYRRRQDGLAAVHRAKESHCSVRDRRELQVSLSAAQEDELRPDPSQRDAARVSTSSDAADLKRHTKSR